MPVYGSETRPAGVDDFPPAARDAVHRLVGWALAASAQDLVSVVVHGSLAWGCWGPASDLDVLVVVEDTVVTFDGFHRMLVGGDAQAPGNGFELSVLSRAAAWSSPHPVDYLYHFSRGRLAREDPQCWDLSAGGRDPDLAGHLRVAWETGIRAYGPPVRRVLRRVSDEEFLASVGADVLDSCEQILRPAPEQVPVPVYAVLNLARTLAWLRDRVVLSKRGGGRWLLERDPSWAALLTAALDDYADPRGRTVSTRDLQELALLVRGLLAPGTDVP